MLGLSDDMKQLLLMLPDASGTFDVIEDLKGRVSDPRSVRALDNLKHILTALEEDGFIKYVSVDAGLTGGSVDHYTGVIFKGFTYGVGDAIVKGGRYDRLLSQFGKDSPAVGFVVLVDDLLSAMSRQGIPVHIADDVITMEYTGETYEKVLKEALKLRHVGGSKIRLIEKKD